MDEAYGNDAAYWHDEYQKLLNALGVLYDAVNQKGTTALRRACKEVVEQSGTCPFDAHNLETKHWETYCDRTCTSSVDMAACWARYFKEVVE